MCLQSLATAAKPVAGVDGAHPRMRGSSKSSMLAPLACERMTLPTTTSPSFSVCPTAGSGACWLSGGHFWPPGLLLLCTAQPEGWEAGWDGFIEGERRSVATRPPCQHCLHGEG